MDDNQLSGLPPEIGGLQNLQSLNLSINQLSDFPAEIIRNLKNLQILDLSDNQLSSLSAEISKLQNLHTLKLSTNKFSSLPVDVLKQMPNLRNLVLKDNRGGIPNPLKKEDIEALRQAIPWCKIVWEEND
ncbi:MAG: leucine-rich repeat domain-containing protein [Lewinellaceae bacterium]|nr:leucine-rich repeat domain-containing protein [Lewinellaceae bacterium]